LASENSKLKKELNMVGSSEEYTSDSSPSARVNDLSDVKNKFHKALSLLEESRETISELKETINQKNLKIIQLQSSKEGVSQNAADDVTNALMSQLMIRTKELEKAQQKTSKLQNALDKIALEEQDAETAVNALSDEQQRRLNIKKQFIRNLLREALIAEKEGRFERAVWNYKKVLDNDSRNKLALQRLGHLSLETGKDDDAELYLRRAFYIDPDDIDTLTGLGFVYVRQNQLRLALSILSRALALGADNVDVYRSMGIVCVGLNWHDAAEDAFRKALDLSPNDAISAFHLAMVLATGDNPRLPEARKLYHQARDLGASGNKELDAFFKY